MTDAGLREFLEASYHRFNRSEYIDPDPLLVAREYGDVRDREIAGLVASCLAVGRAQLIVQASRDILSRMHDSPRAFLEASSRRQLRSAFDGFRYRFFSGDDIAALLFGVKLALGGKAGSGGARDGSDTVPLGSLFSSCVNAGDETVADGLSRFIAEISGPASFAKNLLPSPANGSACKRPLLYLRWMIRADAVDPGGWDAALTPLLVQPMDTHMTWVAERLSFAACKSAPNLKTALEVTRRFREISPADPVRYDFALTRPGIREDLDRDEWFRSCSAT